MMARTRRAYNRTQVRKGHYVLIGSEFLKASQLEIVAALRPHLASQTRRYDLKLYRCPFFA